MIQRTFRSLEIWKLLWQYGHWWRYQSLGILVLQLIIDQSRFSESFVEYCSFRLTCSNNVIGTRSGFALWKLKRGDQINRVGYDLTFHLEGAIPVFRGKGNHPHWTAPVKRRQERVHCFHMNDLGIVLLARHDAWGDVRG